MAHGVYRVAGASRPELEELRAAWLQLAPELQTDRRGAAHGVVDDLAAAVAPYAAAYGLPDATGQEFLEHLTHRCR